MGRRLCALIPVLLATTASGAAPASRTFIFTNSSRDLGEFRAFAKIASRLKPHGSVQIDIGVLASKAMFEMPPAWSAWHEYAIFNANLSKFFPHPQIAPYLPADWVTKNRELLMAKAAILRELGLEAALSSNDTHYLPEAFFEKYLHLRGPRVDHPRRSLREEFTYCVDLAETRDIIASMVADMKRHVPEIKTILVHTNDSGTGLCWADQQYSGPNGPAHCKRRNVGERVRDLMEAMHRGAELGSGPVTIRLGGNFTSREIDEIRRQLPPDTYLSGRDPAHIDGRNDDPATIGITTQINASYPVLGLVNPLAIFEALERLDDPGVRTVVINTSLSWYYRADEPVKTVEKMVDLVEVALADPAHGLLPRFNKVRQIAARWGGEKNADRLFEAFHQLDEAFRLKQIAAPNYSNLYAGVSMRLLTRPLLIRPGDLGSEDEAYFLPHVFNVSREEARLDYIDLHGGRMSGPASWEDPLLRQSLSSALEAAQILEGATGAPEKEWLELVAIGLRMWSSELRSINNFYFAQRIRDSHAKELSGPPLKPSKTSTFAGDSDYLLWNEIQRAEYDNTAELLSLIRNGGLEMIARARRVSDEDVFLLGPDLAGALEHKRRIMRQHWLDVQQYLTSPLK
ncbi:MAG: hypothetical protein DMG57_16550 [Acidobacteria bacterium]|nr:MAG: hypothetical protein DMG57_16550 [Acidobacteriota bacterium]